MAGFWGKRKREDPELQAQDADLAKRAGTALVAADERIRVTTDELIFAEAELGHDATTELRVALAAVRQHLGEAFRLNQLNHDEILDTSEELRSRNARIVQLCDWAEDVLDDRTSALAERIARARRAPEIIAGVRADAARLRARIPHARDTIERLAARYAREALAQVESNPAEADQLLGFAEHSAGVAERRREAGQREQANPGSARLHRCQLCPLRRRGARRGEAIGDRRSSARLRHVGQYRTAHTHGRRRAPAVGGWHDSRRAARDPART